MPLALGGVLALLLVGCMPTTAPPAEPTPAFSSEAEAVAAAEETYRAYVDALNRVDLSDPATFEDVYAWTTGDANAGAREAFSEMYADGLTVDGPTEIAALGPSAIQPDSANSIDIDVCLDVSEVTLVDEDGRSVVAEDRRDVQSMLVTMEAEADSPTGLLIAEISGRNEGLACID